MRYSKKRNASIGCLNLTLGARNVIWAFLFHFSFVSSASWLILRGVMSARCQAAIPLLRIVISSGILLHLSGFFVRGMTAMWVALIAHSRIILNQQYIPCSPYQTCLVCDSVTTAISDPNARGHHDDRLAWFWTMDVPRDTDRNDWMSECMCYTSFWNFHSTYLPT